VSIYYVHNIVVEWRDWKLHEAAWNKENSARQCLSASVAKRTLPTRRHSTTPTNLPNVCAF